MTKVTRLRLDDYGQSACLALRRGMERLAGWVVVCAAVPELRWFAWCENPFAASRRV